MLAFDQIDALRASNGLTRRAVYERAGVNGETWRRIAKAKTAPNTRTLARLTEAVTALVREKEAANG
jgi:transcriptional regulator with XRE-family HTH domain